MRTQLIDLEKLSGNDLGRRLYYDKTYSKAVLVQPSSRFATLVDFNLVNMPESFIVKFDGDVNVRKMEIRNFRFLIEE